MSSLLKIPVLAAALLVFSAGLSSAEKVPFEEGRFTIDFPKTWKKAKDPGGKALVFREAPGGEGTFSVQKLAVKKDHRANLEGTLDQRVEAIKKAKLKVAGEVKKFPTDFDGKKALFAIIPIDAEAQGETVKFSYYLVFVDATDMVIIMEATLPRPLKDKIRGDTLKIIQSFREVAKKK